ncbi:hypothetical protein J1N35_025673 [Gossypium stocksii]|uniref:Uncharacterized protein n=1 Tax=Gossypium stocksii TaxID=47602 RepID=A0A9D3V798_9ROSI|nr:hypothetical protein J1N35_025673 [Gossypium stocksii]
MDVMQGIFNIAMGELTEKDDAFEATVTVLKEQIEKLKGKLIIYKVALGNRVLTAAPKPKVDIPKPKEFKRIRSTKDVDNFLCGMEQYFHAKGIMDDTTNVNIVVMYFTDVTLL